MSFVDLAKLTTHRRAEMEGRINTFNEKCDRAITDIKKLKMQAHSFLSQLNCDPVELKEKFLTLMKKLDEYTYLITDFNLAIGQIEDLNSENTPEQDNSLCLPLSTATYTFNPNNLMDALSESAPSTSCACSNLCPPEKPKRIKVPKEEQVLIAFSSSSTSSESMPSRKSEMVTKEVQCSLEDEMKSVNLEDATPPSPELMNLPAQSILQVDHEYPGIITAIAGSCFWVITDDRDELADYMQDVTDYYKKNDMALTIEQLRALTYCAAYDEETSFYYRALYIKEEEEDPDRVGLFLLDTGEMRICPVQHVRPLAAPFFNRPPYARFCHLAGIVLIDYNDKELMQKYEDIMHECLDSKCVFYVDENESESVGVYVTLENGDLLNDIVVRNGLALPIDKSPPAGVSGAASMSGAAVRGPPELLDSQLIDTPEYTDPVVAVTGYHNRDEEDICKHYKGSPNKTCFKGPRCPKKHIMKHPDGWTLDRVGVVGRIKALPLPAAGAWLRVQVTAVPHFDRVYVNIIHDKQHTEEVPDFGVVLPPTTLQALVRDMNSAAVRASYKPLQLAPAPGEYVAAVYPPDGRFYRACVRMAARGDQSVEVQYIDYGTVMWVKEDQIFQLEERFAALPAQGVRCALAGVFCASENSQAWVRARTALANMIQDKIVHCHVIARDYDEITVELLDDEEYSVAEQLAAQGVVELREYALSDDKYVAHVASVA